MKRNNLFMLAYISFIIAGIFIRLFLDYPLWSSLVLAITLSSTLFSLGDLFATLEKAVEDSCDIAEAFSDDVYEDLEKRLSLIDKIDKIVERYRDTQNDMSDIQNSFIPIIENTEKLMQALNDLLSEVQIKRVKQNQYQKIADTLAYLGFLLLFCTLIFVSFITIPTIIQEIITVLSFSIILITNQVKINLSEKIKKEIIYSQKVLRSRNEAKDFFSKLEEKQNYLTELIESPTMETEDRYNAN